MAARVSRLCRSGRGAGTHNSGCPPPGDIKDGQDTPIADFAALAIPPDELRAERRAPLFRPEPRRSGNAGKMNALESLLMPVNMTSWVVCSAGVAGLAGARSADGNRGWSDGRENTFAPRVKWAPGRLYLMRAIPLEKAKITAKMIDLHLASGQPRLLRSCRSHSRHRARS